MSIRSSYGPDTVSMRGIVAGIVGGRHISAGVEIIDINIPSTSWERKDCQ